MITTADLLKSTVGIFPITGVEGRDLRYCIAMPDETAEFSILQFV